MAHRLLETKCFQTICAIIQMQEMINQDLRSWGCNGGIGRVAARPIPPSFPFYSVSPSNKGIRNRSNFFSRTRSSYCSLPDLSSLFYLRLMAQKRKTSSSSRSKKPSTRSGSSSSRRKSTRRKSSKSTASRRKSGTRSKTTRQQTPLQNPVSSFWINLSLDRKLDIAGVVMAQ